MFDVITRRDMIRGVVKAWKKQYDTSPHNDDNKKAILRRLEALDLENVSREVVDGVIGNNAWTELRCHTCDSDNDKVVHLKDVEYFELFCEECLAKMLRLLRVGSESDSVPNVLRGVICMIENGQHDLAVDLLNKKILELEVS